MIEKTRTQTRSLAEEVLKLNRQVIDWNLDANKRFEKQMIAAFDMSRSTLNTVAELQHSTLNAWLDLAAPQQTA